MLLIVSALLAVLPLLGIVWVLMSRSITTVDGLFLSLILLSISGIFALNAIWELQRQRRRAVWFNQHPDAARQFKTMSEAEAAGILRGRVERVQFYEAHESVLNAVVHHLDKMPGARRPTVDVAIFRCARYVLPSWCSRNIASTWRQGLKYGIDMIERFSRSADHHAVAAL